MTDTSKQFAVYNGRNVDQMPLMLRQGVVPLSVAGFMGNRERIMEQFGDIYADTSDLVAYDGERNSDEVRMILTVDNQGRITDNRRGVLELINPTQERTQSRAIALSNDFYNGLNFSGVVPLSRKELAKYGVDTPLTEAQVLNHPAWRVLLRHSDAVPTEFAYDKGFMEEVVGRTFRQRNVRNGSVEGMGVYLDSAQGDTPEMKAWYVLRLGYGSDVGDGGGLDDGYGRLVSVRQKALEGRTVHFKDDSLLRTQESQTAQSGGKK